MRITKLLIGLLFVAWLLPAMPVYAEKKAEEKVLTKGEAITLLSTSNFVKKKINELVSWTVGYDISKLSRVKLVPTIIYVKAVPKRVPPDGRTVVEILASVDDPGGLGNISRVRADLSSIGRLSNTMLVDNGLYGDKKAADGIYTLQSSASPKVKTGSKDIPIAVANKKGWLALAKTSLDIRMNPVIIEAKFSPREAKADGQSMVSLVVKVENPGRLEDLERVSADLSSFGYGERTLLRNDGKDGDALANDDLYTLWFNVPVATRPGDYKIQIEAQNLIGGFASYKTVLKVHK